MPSPLDKFEIDELRAVRVLAMKAVVDAEGDLGEPKIDYDYFVRKLCRWFAETFETPYHVVCRMPVLDLFQHFYEHKYERMDESERHEELVQLCETVEEAAERKKKEESASAADDDFFKEAMELAKKKNKGKSLEAISIPREEPGFIPTLGGKVEVPILSQEELKSVEKLPTFDMDFDMDKMDELDILAKPPVKTGGVRKKKIPPRDGNL